MYWSRSIGCGQTVLPLSSKKKGPFYFVARYENLTGLKMTWNFLGSGHGKGEHDGAGAVIKRHFTHEQLKPDCIKLLCAVDVVPFFERDYV